MPKATRLVFYDAVGKGGGVAARAFDNGGWNMWQSMQISTDA